MQCPKKKIKKIPLFWGTGSFAGSSALPWQWFSLFAVAERLSPGCCLKNPGLDPFFIPKAVSSGLERGTS